MLRPKPPNDFSIERLLSESPVDSEFSDNLEPASSHTQSSSNQLMKGQRRRSTFSAIQVHVLENEFYKHRYVSAEKRAGLAAFLGLSQQQIKIWFQNRRYKTKVKNGGGRRDQTSSKSTEQPIVSVPLQSTNPSIFPAWLLQKRASILADLARQSRPQTSGDQLHSSANLSPKLNIPNSEQK